MAQVLWVSGRSGWRKGKGEEYCLEFGQVLLEHVTNFESGGRDTWAPSYSFSLEGAAPAQGQARWSQVLVLVRRRCMCVCGGVGRPSLGNNRWFTKKYQGDASIKKERCVYSMISTDQMHIHRMKVTPVNDSRVWPTLRRQRHGVEWVLMARVTSPRAPIIKLKKKKSGRGSRLVGPSARQGVCLSLWPMAPCARLTPWPFLSWLKKKKKNLKNKTKQNKNNNTDFTLKIKRRSQQTGGGKKDKKTQFSGFIIKNRLVKFETE